MGYNKTMNKELIRSLIKDYDLPIAFYEEPYFTHFKNLLDPFYKITEKIELMNQALKTKPQSDFIGQYKVVSDKVIQAILSNAAYQEFNSMKIEEKYKTPHKGFEQAQRLYTEHNVSTDLICSIDLVKANFSVLKAHNPEIVCNAKTYQDLMGQFTDCQYLIGSKKIRQVIFGNLNPKRQQTLQRYYMSWVKHYLVEQGGLQDEQILLSSSDELVFKLSGQTPETVELMIEKCFENSETEVLKNDYRLSFFKLKQIHPDHAFFAKEYLNPKGQVDFKNVPAQYLAQVVRYYLNQPIQEMDRKFILDNQVATFDNNLLK